MQSASLLFIATFRSVRVVDIESGRLLSSIPVAGLLSIHVDVGRMVVGTQQGRIIMYDVQSEKVLAEVVEASAITHVLLVDQYGNIIIIGYD